MGLPGRAWTWLSGLDPVVADGLQASSLTVLALVPLVPTIQHPRPGIWWLIPAVTLPLLLRRRHPFACISIQAAAIVAVFDSNGVATIAALLIGVYSLGAHARHRRLSLLAAALTACAGVAAVGLGEAAPVSTTLVPFLVIGPVWFLGGAVRARTLRAEVMEERAARLERERDAEMAEAIAAERTRIARELHDVVAHSVSVMVVQTGAARHVLRDSHELADESLLSVETAGREALLELRHLLELLHDDADQPALAPQPGVAELSSLVERLAAAGQPVELTICGNARPLPPGLGLAVYRVVQEALTNALKHAPGAGTTVRLEYGQTHLQLEVLDDGTELLSPRTATGTGRGLVGMQERVSVYGGELDVGPRPEGGFAVRARLPLVPI